MQVPSLGHHEAPLLPYLPLSRVISQFRPPMLVSQERMMRPPLDTVIASGRDKDHCHFKTCSVASCELHHDPPPAHRYKQTLTRYLVSLTVRSASPPFPIRPILSKKNKKWELRLSPPWRPGRLCLPCPWTSMASTAPSAVPLSTWRHTERYESQTWL